MTDTETRPKQSAVASYYDETYAKTHLDADEKGQDFSKIASLWPERAGKLTVLDVGCGAGVVTGPLVEKGHRVVGVDVMAPALERASKRGLEPVHFDLNDGPLPLESHTFDALVALDILEHVFDPVRVLQDFRRVLKPDGFLITLIPNHFDLRQRWRMMRGQGIVHLEHLRLDPTLNAANYFHIRFFTLKEAAELLEMGGFRIEKTRYTHFQYHPLLRNRIGHWMTQKMPQSFASAAQFRAVPRAE